MHPTSTPHRRAAQAPLDPVAGYAGTTTEIATLPSRFDVRCPACGHTGTALLRLVDIHRLKCSQCGCATPIVTGRDPLRARRQRKHGGR